MYENLLSGKRVLVLEDQIIIAMEVEFNLRQMGASDVVLAASVREALRAIGESMVDIAVLDINLGPSVTSLPVAEALSASGAPWVFATGYGDEVALPSLFKRACIVRKPYTTEMLGRALVMALSANQTARRPEPIPGIAIVD